MINKNDIMYNTTAGMIVGYGYTVSTGTDISYEDINEVSHRMARQQQLLGVIHEFKRNSEETGSYVQLLNEFACCPVMIGSDENPVFLYELIEVIDENIDYERLKQELPTLSYSHFSGAISFLRRLSQFNINSIDIDELEDEEFLSSEKLLGELRTALTEGNKHVLNFIEFNSRSAT